MKDLLDTIRNITPIPTDEGEKLSSITHTQSIQKGQLFISAGTVPQKFAFVREGLFRYFYADKHGQEFTKGFFPEGSFIISYSAMISRRGSYFSIEALEDACIEVIDFSKWTTLCGNHPAWTPLLIAMLEKGYMKKENRERELLLFDAEERYRLFLSEYPLLEPRVKQHLIASYLGITPVALSRIRRKMKDGLPSLT